MRRFDYSFLKQTLPAELFGTSNILYDLRAHTELRKGSNPGLFQAIREQAIIDSVGSSNAIEGIVTTKTRLSGLVKGSLLPQTRQEQEILGYKRALALIFEDPSAFPIREQTILELHQILLEDVSPEAGRYKNEDNLIIERDASGLRRIRFTPVPAADTPLAMEQLLLAYQEAAQDASVNRLLLSFCFLVDFLSIHPFHDGNGRISRLLTNLMLLQNGFDIGRYISLEGKIHEYRAAYYEALQRSSQGWHLEQNSYTPFMVYMMQILYQCYKQLDERFQSGQLAAMPKHEQIRTLLQNTLVPLSKEEIYSRLPDISVTTVERVLGQMVKEGQVIKIGQGRATRYRRG